MTTPTPTPIRWTCADAVAQARRYHAEGRTTRRQWRGTATDGREMLCLWLSLSPPGTPDEDFTHCDAIGVSESFARLILWMNDTGTSRAAWPALVERVVTLVERAHVLTPDDWTTLDYAWRGQGVREAMRHTTILDALDARIAAREAGHAAS